MITRRQKKIAAETIRQYNKENRQAVYEQFADKVANILGSDIEEVRELNRKQELMHIRRIVVEMLSRRFKDIKPDKIGKVIKRDRTSILHYQNGWEGFIMYEDTKRLLRKVEINI